MKLDVPKRRFDKPETSKVQFQTPTGGRKSIGQTEDYQFCELPFQVPTYTVATAPDADTAVGAIIYVSDGDAGSATLAFSDGTNWKAVATNANIATS